jgi:pilus assembly protein Flp/PilA
MSILAKMARDTEGATAIEYALIAVFIGIALIVSMQSLGNALTNNFNALTNAENNANTTASA